MTRPTPPLQPLNTLFRPFTEIEVVVSGTKVESIEEEIQEIKIEDMESRNQERRMAGVFKETPLIFENGVTLVNHQLFDQSPQPNQVKLSKSEPIFVKI
jgi:hypothetical protein